MAATEQDLDLKRNPLRWPILLGLAAGVIGALVGWLVIRERVHELDRKHEFVGRLFRFPISLSLFAGGVTYWLTRRMLIGPDITRDEWTLVLDEVQTIGEVRVGDIKRALTTRGYEPIVRTRDGVTGAEIDATEDLLLVGHEVIVRERTAKHGQIVLTLSATTATAPQWGSLAVSDTERGTYDELAQYLLAALGALLPGMQHKRTFSNLSPDVSVTLAEQLPDHPVRLR